MNLSALKEKINRSPVWKGRIHRLMFCNARPRWWVKHLLNPVVFRRQKGTTIRRQTVLNVSPINQFQLGAYSTIEEYCVLDNGVGDIIIGCHTRIGLRNTLIGPLSIGNHVILAQNIVLSGLNHCYQDIERPIHQQGVNTAPLRIEDDCWIGAGSFIAAGVTIGRHVVVAANSVVTKDVPPYSIVAGNPAKIIKKYNSATNLWERV
ncbi:MAG: acyltransferase [Bacteroides sp.]|nr:acyltransferase [Bacteroides sp.]